MEYDLSLIHIFSTKVVGLSQTEEGAVVSYENAEGNGSVIAEKLLMSVGRRPVTKGFGLENLNLEKTERGAIRVNERCRLLCRACMFVVT